VSHVVSSIVQRRKVGSPTRKAVLMFMAGCASDDGTGIWTSKQSMADDLEMGRRTVQVCIDDLLSEGLIRETGRRACRNGFTVEYSIVIEAIEALPSTRENGVTRAGRAPVSTRAGDAPVQDVHMTRAGRARQDVQDVHINLPRTIHEPRKEEPPCVPPEAKPEPKARLPADWTLSDEGWAYARSKKIPDEDIADEARGFHAYWSDRSGPDARKSARGWEQCWAGWCRRIAGRYAAGRGMAFQAKASGHGRGSSLASVVAQRIIDGKV
jgi:hypothetical protein